MGIQNLLQESQGVSEMTRPDPLRAMAEQIAAFFDPDPTGFQMDETLKRLRTAHRQGQESMREKCANKFRGSQSVGYIQSRGSSQTIRKTEVVEKIMSIALEPETEGGV